MASSSCYTPYILCYVQSVLLLLPVLSQLAAWTFDTRCSLLRMNWSRDAGEPTMHCLLLLFLRVSSSCPFPCSRHFLDSSRCLRLGAQSFPVRFLFLFSLMLRNFPPYPGTLGPFLFLIEIILLFFLAFFSVFCFCLCYSLYCFLLLISWGYFCSRTPGTHAFFFPFRTMHVPTPLFVSWRSLLSPNFL